MAYSKSNLSAGGYDVSEHGFVNNDQYTFTYPHKIKKFMIFRKGVNSGTNYGARPAYWDESMGSNYLRSNTDSVLNPVAIGTAVGTYVPNIMSKTDNSITVKMGSSQNGGIWVAIALF